MVMFWIHLVQLVEDPVKTHFRKWGLPRESKSLRIDSRGHIILSPFCLALCFLAAVDFHHHTILSTMVCYPTTLGGMNHLLLWAKIIFNNNLVYIVSVMNLLTTMQWQLRIQALCWWGSCLFWSIQSLGLKHGWTMDSPWQHPPDATLAGKPHLKTMTAPLHLPLAC